ncbi:MAG: zinc finger A20 and AN1 domain-containing stress-associated protein 6-like protein [Terrestrivirus sp.]|uniref:Zinc finger A20 and AN1 domain-containing stress-associated protein 6-like protein n=1 Tax=Terrestrivirus sp. TaxID=2487775 RepID=A0A3G4ZMC6_9VIRU|nr:MAG: zinc finger A20 and AN1 domain-containing stress-associated protein 6-like protein [Terrestrivirus sp.]
MSGTNVENNKVVSSVKEKSDKTTATEIINVIDAVSSTKLSDPLNKLTNPKVDTNNVTNMNKSDDKPKNKCYQCNKKVGLLNFVCKCAGSFCSSHRHPESHNCTYDHKADGIEKLIKNNPVIVADKMGNRLI